MALYDFDGGIVIDETLPQRVLVALVVLLCTLGFASGVLVFRHLHRHEEPFFFNCGLPSIVRIPLAYTAQLVLAAAIVALAVNFV